MHTIRNAALADYNAVISSFREATVAEAQDTVVFTLKCGSGERGGAHNIFECINSSIVALQPLAQYKADGNSTPLYDAVAMMMDKLSEAPDAAAAHVSFVVMVTTDGLDNSSRMALETLAERIRALQATDRWTVLFRVPRGSAKSLSRLGIPEGNLLEWDVSQRGVEAAQAVTLAGVQRFMKTRAAGAKSVASFFTNLAAVDIKAVATTMENITKDLRVLPVVDGAPLDISGFIFSQTGQPLKIGGAFYELTKKEKAVQDHKNIIIQDKGTGHYYGGDHARSLLGLPSVGTIALTPADHGSFRIYIQSTSTNRKLVAGTNLLLCSNEDYTKKRGRS